VPVAGTVRRSCNGTGRDGEVRVMGLMEIVGAEVLIGSLLDWDCMMNGLLVVLKVRCCSLVVVKVALDKGFDV
jgi:hypothetical protein